MFSTPSWIATQPGHSPAVAGCEVQSAPPSPCTAASLSTFGKEGARRPAPASGTSAEVGLEASPSPSPVMNSAGIVKWQLLWLQDEPMQDSISLLHLPLRGARVLGSRPMFQFIVRETGEEEQQIPYRGVERVLLPRRATLWLRCDCSVSGSPRSDGTGRKMLTWSRAGPALWQPNGVLTAMRSHTPAQRANSIGQRHVQQVHAEHGLVEWQFSAGPQGVSVDAPEMRAWTVPSPTCYAIIWAASVGARHEWQRDRPSQRYYPLQRVAPDVPVPQRPAVHQPDSRQMR